MPGRIAALITSHSVSLSLVPPTSGPHRLSQAARIALETSGQTSRAIPRPDLGSDVTFALREEEPISERYKGRGEDGDAREVSQRIHNPRRLRRLCIRVHAQRLKNGLKRGSTKPRVAASAVGRV